MIMKGQQQQLDMDKWIEKGDVLIEALPYIQRFNRKIIVVKYGGSAMLDENFMKSVIQDITLLKLVGFKPIIVHGGGKAISRHIDRLGMETQFINGLRVTDEDTLEAAEMVLNSVNKKLVQIVEQLGVRAIGISGKDGRLLTVKKKLSEGQDIGYVGEVTHVNEDILLELLEDDFLPIVCPIGLDEDYHGYNINADDAASAIAEAVKAEKLADKIFLMEIEAPRVARACQPGQFLIVKMDEVGERIPLTICDYNREKGTVTIVFQTVGASTEKMSWLREGDFFQDVTGPLGKASEWIEDDIEELKQKKILFVAGGVGTAPVYPQVKWLHEHGVAADVIVGAKNKELLILEKEMEAVAGNLYVTTDDGSYGRHGMVTAVIEELSAKGTKYDFCVAIGPMIMMKFVCLLTKKLEIPTIVSMNPIMVDGTGMCGACRLLVDGKVKFACVDGPEFDGHLVDFDQAMQRQQSYKTQEGRAMLKLQEGSTHHGGCGNCGGDR